MSAYGQVRFCERVGGPGRLDTFSIAAVKERRLFKHSELAVEQLAELLAPPVRGWMACCCRFRGSQFQPIADYIDRSTVRWAMPKSKRLRGHKRRGIAWLDRLKRKSPALFVHWCGRGGFAVGTTGAR